MGFVYGRNGEVLRAVKSYDTEGTGHPTCMPLWRGQTGRYSQRRLRPAKRDDFLGYMGELSFDSVRQLNGIIANFVKAVITASRLSGGRGK